MSSPGKATQPAPAEPGGPSPGPRVGTGRLTARTGRDAVNHVERAICGPGAVRSAGEAEGMALAGRRAATLLLDDAGATSGGGRGGAVPWIRHRVRGLGVDGSAAAFELVATDAQQAVDHCLVAHRAARRLGRAGAAAIDAETANALQVVRLPETSAIDACLAARPDGEDGRPSALDAVREALRAVAGVTGRDLAPVRGHRVDDALYVLVADGATAGRARDLADELRAAGVACGALELQLVLPFPADEVRETLHGAAVVAALQSCRDSAAWFGALKGALDGNGTARLEQLSLDGPDGLSAAGLAAALGLSGRALGLSPGARPARETFTLALTPAGAWGAELLRDVASALAAARGMRLAPGPMLGPAALTVCVADGTVDAGALPVDLLFAAGPELLDDAVLGRLRHGGTVVLEGAAADAETRRRVEAAGGELRLVDTVASGARAVGPAATLATLQRALLEAAGLGGTPPSGSVEPAAEPADLEALRRFHATGVGAHSALEPLGGLPLVPALAAELRRSYPPWNAWPLVLVDGEASSLHALLERAADRARSEGPELTLIGPHLAGAARAVAQRLDAGPATAELGGMLDGVLEDFAATFDVSAAGARSLRGEIARLVERLPRSGTVFGFRPEALLALAGEAARSVRARRAAEDDAALAALVEKLAEKLAVDDALAAAATSSTALAATLPGAAAQRLDPAALARNLPERRGSKRLAPPRRARIERALTVLRSWLAARDSRPELHLVHAPGAAPGVDSLRAAVVEHDDPCDVALGLYDGLALDAVELARAERTAVLESRDEYVAERHDALLARLDRGALGAHELRRVPPVLVLESAARLQGAAMASFSRLLRSGRPVGVIVLEPAGGERVGTTWEALSGAHPGLGYLAVAHREAFVVQSTLADPLHLFAGLERMASAASPAVAVVAAPDWSAPVSPWLQLVAAREGRATPCFAYDADAGATWSERFDLAGNPEPEAIWPRREESFTFAHAAALDPSMRAHFRIAAPDIADDALLELDAWLEADEREAGRRLPFIRVVDAAGEVARAVVDRDLTLACRDRRRAWRILQELAGTDNAYAHRAAEGARQQALLEAERERRELAERHAAEVEEVRSQAAAAAVERIVAVLMGSATAQELGDTAALFAAATPAPAAAAPAPAEAPPEPEQETEEEEADAGFREDPFIVSALCTTCEECINVNSRMFHYNGNKQATIADPTAGTFEELVRAAEKCPARCIHPGAPRPDDTSVTDDLIARAARYR